MYLLLNKSQLTVLLFAFGVPPSVVVHSGIPLRYVLAKYVGVFVTLLARVLGSPK